jgi:hypothetical protein
MLRRTYIITFDKGGLFDLFDYNKFHQSIINASGLISWWHYLESTYIIVVNNNVTATNVSEFLRQIAPNKQFFVTEINLRSHNGFLPQEAWDWINKFANEF